jgi:hypothetical protein
MLISLGLVVLSTFSAAAFVGSSSLVVVLPCRFPLEVFLVVVGVSEPFPGAAGVAVVVAAVGIATNGHM